MSGEQGVIGSILASYERLSESERRIADFILQSQGNISSLTGGEIAQGSKTSNTTVSRFVRTLGYASFSQLRLALAREEAAREHSLGAAGGIALDHPAESVRYILERKVEELTDTAASLDADELAAVCRIIQASNTVMFAGAGSSLSMAQMAAIKMSHVGVRAVSPATTDAAALLAQVMDEHDCIVLVSNSGTSRRLSIVLDNAADAAVPTVAITASPASPLARRTDHVLVAANHDHLVAKDFAVSHMGIELVVECLLLLLYSDSPDAQEYLRMFNKAFSREKSAGE